MTTPAAVLAGEARWCVVSGDCLDALATIPRGGAIVVTDPPYGVDTGTTTGSSGRGGGSGLSKVGRGYAGFEDTYAHFVEAIVPRLNLALDRAERAAVFTGPHIHEQRKPDAIGGVFCPAAVARNLWGFKSFLPVLLYGKKPNGNLGSYPTAVSSVAVAARSEHPVPKPLEWMLWIVQLATLFGECVLDPFCGSGTTGVAALRLGRRFIGIEMHEPYAAEARERLEAEASGQSLIAARAGQVPLFDVTKRKRAAQ